MKKTGVFIAGLCLLLLFLSYQMTYIVNFDETAVLTTFGAASEASVRNADGNHSGLFFKFPWPVQQVLRFDRRTAILEDRFEQQETRDKKVVIIKAYVTWRISDPLCFYRMFRTVDRAESFLLERLRASKSEMGLFTFDELTNVDPSQLRISEANDALLHRIHHEFDMHSTGMQVLSCGINRIVLPENITRSVFQRMKQTRQRQAQNARSEGNAIANSIVAKTDGDRRRILAFTEMTAQRLRAQGDAAAARYYREYSRSPEFAIFLRKLDAFKASLRENTTLILDTDSEPFDLLDEKK